MMASSGLTPNNTIGALEIGVLVSYVLFGISTAQFYKYLNGFPEDSCKLKCLVAFVWLCEMIVTICFGDLLYTVTITDYGEPSRLFQGRPRMFVVSLAGFNGFISATVQGFFAVRIWALSNKSYIPVISWLLSSLRLVGSIALFIGGVLATNIFAYEAQWGSVAIAIWCTSVVNDIGITVTLIFLLYNHRNEGYQRITGLVDKIIMWTLATGMLTSLFTIATLIFFLLMRDNFIWGGLECVGTHLFANSMLASLNGRATLRAMSEASIPLSLSRVLNFSPDGDVETSKTTVTP